MEKVEECMTPVHVYSKHSKNLIEAKALFVFLTRCLCNYKCSEICRILGNITQGRVSMLSSHAIKLIDDDRFGDIIREFLDYYAA
jgi:hypothetical protein